MISLESVSKRYAEGTEAVSRLSLEIPDGSLTVLVGPPGCGKTTILLMINRMIEPSGGRILLDGSDIRRRPIKALRRDMGLVLPRSGLFPHQTVLENIGTVPRMLGCSRQSARIQVMELMERVALGPALARRYPHELSADQRQRAGIARALAADPPVLLMDDPFSAVGPKARSGLQELLPRLQAESRKTIVLVTRDIDEALRVGDLVGVLCGTGRLAQFASPDRLLSAPADSFVEDLLGADRGMRRLSFFTSAGLALTTDPIVAMDAPPEQVARRVASGVPCLLVTDSQGYPLGWADPEEWTAGKRMLAPYGRPFEFPRGSLRSVLDCSMLSPTGWAVAVDKPGRVVGVVSQEAIVAAIREAQIEQGAELGAEAAERIVGVAG